MSASTMFVNEEKKATIQGWFEKFRKNIPVATEEAVVETSFGRTHALLAGPQNAPPLVVCHGALASSAHVMPELGPLLRTRRVVALDVIGQSSQSEDRRIDLGDDSYGRWLIEATDALGFDRYDLFGVSWGGFVAARAACTAPERVGHLVLLVPAGWVAGGAWAGFTQVGWPMLMFKTFPSEKRLLRVVRALFTTVDPDWTAYFGDALQSYRMDMRLPPIATPEQLSKITCPTLVFGAEHDLSFPGQALIARAKELIPHAEVELLEGSRHCPPLTDAFREQLGSRIERFLRET